MSRQASSGVPRKALKFVGFILLLAAIAACFGLLAKEPADAGHLAHYGLRLLLIALCLTGWFWTQAMIALVEGATVIILRVHYTMDVLAAIAASWCAFSLSVWLQGPC